MNENRNDGNPGHRGGSSSLFAERGRGHTTRHYRHTKGGKHRMTRRLGKAGRQPGQPRPNSRSVARCSPLALPLPLAALAALAALNQHHSSPRAAPGLCCCPSVRRKPSLPRGTSPTHRRTATSAKNTAPRYQCSAPPGRRDASPR